MFDAVSAALCCMISSIWCPAILYTEWDHQQLGMDDTVRTDDNHHESADSAEALNASDVSDAATFTCACTRLGGFYSSEEQTLLSS
jgi:archaellum component FlaF (FlaF/FlaG flagellin family)